MKKWFKRGIFAIVTFVIVALVGAAVFLLTFDPNAYKEKVEQLVYERYQRALRIDGEIELSLFPRIGLSVADVSLSHRNSPESFASVESARFAVAVWPLLWNRLVVDHVAVSGFKVWLSPNNQDALNAKGSLLIATLVPSSSSGAPIENSSPLIPDTTKTEFQIDIAGLDLKEGEIHFFDTQTQRQLQLTKLEVNTGRMTFNQPFDVIFKGRLVGENSKTDATIEGQTVLQLEPQLNRYMAQRINIALTGALGAYQATSAQVKGAVEVLMLNEVIQARNIEIITQGRWQDELLTLNKANIKLNVLALRLTPRFGLLGTEQFKLQASGLLPVTANAQPEHKVQLAVEIPKLDLNSENIQSEPISLSFKQSQGQKLFDLSAGFNALTGTMAEMQFEGVYADILDKNSNATTHLDAHVTGAAQWLTSKKQINFTGLWQSANTRAQFESVLTSDPHWQLGLKVDATEIDINLVPWFNTENSRPAFLSYLSWLSLPIQLELAANLFDGKLQATGSWLPSRSQSTLNAQFSQINFLPLSEALAAALVIDGRGSLSVDLQSQGATPTAWLANLDGVVQLEAKDGKIVGWDFWQQLNAVNKAVLNVFSGQIEAPEAQYSPEQSTAFNQLNLGLKLQQGQAQIEGFHLQAPGLVIKTEPKTRAYVDFINHQLSLELQAQLQQKKLTTEQKALSSYATAPLYIRVNGPLSAPLYRWQWQRLTHPAIKEAIDGGLLDLLEHPVGCLAVSLSC